ncbi:Protein ROOT PRIMORDIUM defective 1 [Vitis vinifera]|uniref:Protein ROOT PRIMORDIUM defective 1 n=1 Tax=Vitis vinifera TaxID=29760 RepID=A0A438CX21_VITVI|nr:Protein ROOT PRIMORDIUM defective 1 [Vitis vinifera]
MPIFYSSPINPLKSVSFLLRSLTWTRPMSQSTSIPKKLQRVRDHGYDNYMEVEKKLRKILKFQDLFLCQPHQTLPVSRLDTLARRLDFKQHEAGAFILKFPHVFEIYEHPVRRILYCRLTRKAHLQIEQENRALNDQIPDAVTRLRKLLMMSNTGRLRLEHIRIARRELGLPDDFEYSSDPTLAVCAIEKLREKEYREKGIDAEDIRFSFIVNFPPGFKIGKYYRIAVWKWQRIPYWSPYEDVSGYDLRSLEAQKRMEKRAIATIHELLSLTVEKKISLERIAHFRQAMNLPKKLKEKANVDRELVNYRRDREDDEMVRIQSDYVESRFEGFVDENNFRQDGERGRDSDLNLDSDAVSDFSDEDNKCEETVDAEI